MKWANPRNINHMKTKSHTKNLENLNRTSKEVKLVTKNVATNRSAEPDGFTVEFYQVLKEQTQVFSNFSKKVKKASLSNPFSEVSIALIPKADKDITRK